MSAPAALSKLEESIVRKLRWRILPFVMLLYFVSYLDRVNVGFAAFTMNKALGLTPAMFGFGSGIFFAGYFLFEVPSNLILYRVGARRWIARVLISWGLVSAACAFVVGPRSFYALRFLLGAAEAGFFPGIVYYLSLWFPARHRAVAIAAFMTAAPLSIALGSPISGALMELPRIAGLDNWQWLFIFEALPAVVLGFVTLKALASTPEEARWLKPEERAWLKAELQAEYAELGARSGHGSEAWRALFNPRVLALAVVYGGTSAGMYAVGFWAPLLLGQLGFSPLTVGWLNALPGIAAIAVMIVWARHSDLTLERTWHVVLPCLTGCVGFLWGGATHAAVAVVLALALMYIGVNASKPTMWPMPNLFLSGAGAAAGIAWINSVGNLGGFFGPFAVGWLKQRSGSYGAGLDAVAAMIAVSAGVMLVLSRQVERRPGKAQVEEKDPA